MIHKRNISKNIYIGFLEVKDKDKQYDPTFILNLGACLERMIVILLGIERYLFEPKKGETLPEEKYC